MGALLEPSSSDDLTPGDLAHQVRKDLRGRLEDLMVARGEAVIPEGGVHLADLMLMRHVKAEQQDGSGSRPIVSVKKEMLLCKEERPTSNVSPVKTCFAAVKREIQPEGQEQSSNVTPTRRDVIERRLAILKKIKERHAPSPAELAEVRKESLVRDALLLFHQGDRKRALAMLDKYEADLEQVLRRETEASMPSVSASPLRVLNAPETAGLPSAEDTERNHTSTSGCTLGQPLKKRKICSKAEPNESDSDTEAARKANMASAVEPELQGRGIEPISTIRQTQASHSQGASSTASCSSSQGPQGNGRKVGTACCRVWVPAAVLPAGDKLVQYLVGPGGKNLSHLRKIFPNASVEKQGEASLSVPPDQRLRLEVLFETGDEAKLVVAAKLVLDVVDLVETACDLAGEEIGLSEDEVQEAYASIRKEYVVSPTASTPHAQPKKPAKATAPADPVELRRQREMLASSFSAGGITISSLAKLHRSDNG